MKSIHKPVLLKVSIDLLNVQKGIYVDCTLGGGGHTLEIIKILKKDGGKIVCFDIDEEAIKRFEKYLINNNWKKLDRSFKKRNLELFLIRENFKELRSVLDELKVDRVDGILADLGISSDLLEDEKRGFSYMKDGPLDMRMDKTLKVKASDLVNGLYKNELEGLFLKNDEIYAKRIANEIIKERKKKLIKTTLHLTNIIKKALPFYSKGKSYHSNKNDKSQLYRHSKSYWIKPAMRVFQALRIAVNSELSSLQSMLPQALDSLAAGNNMVIISFHSGEDRIVKEFIKNKEKENKIKKINRKPIVPGDYEIQKNNRSRSAKLRAFKKLEAANDR